MFVTVRPDFRAENVFRSADLPAEPESADSLSAAVMMLNAVSQVGQLGRPHETYARLSCDHSGALTEALGRISAAYELWAQPSQPDEARVGLVVTQEGKSDDMAILFRLVPSQDERQGSAFGLLDAEEGYEPASTRLTLGIRRGAAVLFQADGYTEAAAQEKPNYLIVHETLYKATAIDSRRSPFTHMAIGHVAASQLCDQIGVHYGYMAEELTRVEASAK